MNTLHPLDLFPKAIMLLIILFIVKINPLEKEIIKYYFQDYWLELVGTTE